MLMFIILTLSFTVAILLAGAIGTMIMLNPKVMNWYLKKAFEYMNKVENVFDEVS